ncbi:probable LRR receptor-like serine/threonine-protein kinase At3g47570 [Ziziphus jujuba]|uniref:Probable LRR receptor-like serine/threonine-protein kinase At3g47570 n=1 Tax=Ziziphus jujuba TaxID=326968 RepID=A0ABM4AAV6_ZIZJJ|nr:probable LRR receptor-like serine/threonine-protein kinase At3g47570 [Ziziphus jujuba]
MGCLLQLWHLNLSINSFGGNIPTNITHCKYLRHFLVTDNKLTGSIPVQLSSSSKLVYLGFWKNILTGTVPAWIGNFTSLNALSFFQNNFQGSISEGLGHLKRLGSFILKDNNPSGIVFPSIYNISSIYYFTFTKDQLHGNLPADVGFTLPNLRVFAGAVNELTDPIPISLSNCSALQVLYFSQNGLIGSVTETLGSLPNVYRINFEYNLLGYGKASDLNFFMSLPNCSVPELLYRVYMCITDNNNIQAIHSIRAVSSQRNRFEGSIPQSLGDYKKLMTLNLSGNNLNVTIPREVMGLSSLSVSLSLSNDLLTGALPSEVAKLKNLGELDLSENKLTGELPSTLGQCISLERLHLEGNQFEGPIPQTLESLRGLEGMDLSRNNLSGLIPKFLGEISTLKFLNLSHNNLRVNC